MKKNKLKPIRVALAVLPLMLLSIWGYSQPSTVQGTVTDETGTPLQGVNVIIQGTTIGTTTDANGAYRIEAGSESTLTFSFMGYLNESVAVGPQTVINVSLIPDITLLGDVVVVGYGTQRRETLTGSISKVDGKEITSSPAVNVTSTLAGKLPGLIINQRDGWPGREGINILIRGTGTFNNNSPLIVIDGVPRDDLQRLNPEDIESITVLKDGSAAIYGARAANGVLLVTTKQGNKGRPEFSLTYNYALSSPTKITDMMDAALFAEVYNEAEWYRQGWPTNPDHYSPFFTDEAIQKFRDGSDPILYPNTNWIDDVLKKRSAQQQVNLQASGGSDNVRYLLSFGMSDQEGFLKNNPTHYRQYNMRSRIDADLTKSITVGVNIYTTFNERTNNATQFVGEKEDLVNVLQSNPTLVSVYPNGLIAPGRFRNNPLLAYRGGYEKVNDNPLFTTFTAKYDVPFIKGLVFDASFNYDLRNEFQKWFRKPLYYHEYNVLTGEFDRMTTDLPIQVRDTYRKWTKSLFNIRAAYETTISSNHNIKIMGGTELQQESHNWAEAYRKNFISPAIPQIDVGSNDPEDKDNRGSAWESAHNNYFGRFNYDFMRKYLLEFVFRYDGSQVFPRESRYGFFPAVSAGWRISEEPFFNDFLPSVNELKIRGSYGELGNDRVPHWQYMQAFQFGNNYVFGIRDIPGIFSSRLPNPNITWEVSKKVDVGITAEMWKGLLGADLTVFSEDRSNILLQRNLSVSKILGFPELPDENIGRVKNRGFEIQLSHRNSIDEFRYSVVANTSFARSEIVYMDEVPTNEAYQAQTGRPLHTGLFYKSDGIFNTQAELDSFPHAMGTRLGDILVVDMNGDGVIDGDDRYRVKYSATPEYVFGLTTLIEYKGLDLTLFFQGQTNVYSYDYTFTEFGEQDLDNNAVYRATNRWNVNNQEGATMPRANSWAPGLTDFFLYDATFIRLKNAELGYRLRGAVAGINSVRIFVNGSNLLTWAKEIKWRDPELDGGFNRYPPMRIINFGVNVQF